MATFLCVRHRSILPDSAGLCTSGKANAGIHIYDRIKDRGISILPPDGRTAMTTARKEHLMTPWNLIDGANVLYVAFVYSGYLGNSFSGEQRTCHMESQCLIPATLSTTVRRKERVGVAVVTISVEMASYPAASTGCDKCHTKNTSPTKSIHIRLPRKIRYFFRDIQSGPKKVYTLYLSISLE